MSAVSEVMAARKALQRYVYETPVIKSNALAQRTGHRRVLLKCENLQRTGSYHLRGYMYKVIRTMEQDMDVDSFVTFSTANGGAALSCAASQFQTAAHVVIPRHLHENITRSIRHYGGRYVEADPTPKGRTEAVAALMEQHNRREGKVQHHAVFVHPYLDRHVMIGYGTIGVEMMLQTDCQIDCVVTPIGGGSLLAGLAIAVRAMKPNVAVFGCRPVSKAICDSYAFFKRGDTTTDPAEKISTDAASETSSLAADAAAAPPHPRVMKADAVERSLRERYPHTQPRLVSGIISVNNEEIRYAFRYIYERCKLVVDAKAAMAVAAVLAKPQELEKYKCVAIVLTGGNVDLNQVPKLAAARL